MLKQLFTLLLLTAICFSNADAQYIFVSSDLETEGTKTSNYTAIGPEEILVKFVHTPGIAIPPLSYPLIFASLIRVYINDVLQYSSGGNLSIINYWSCTLNNVQPSSVVKVQLDFALTGPAYLGNPPATIFVTSRHTYKDINVDYYGEITSPINNLSQNFPNPFNPSTKIAYTLAEDAKVSLKIYDILGVEVAELVNDTKPLGFYEADFNASNLSSGIYIYKITAVSGERILFSESKRMILMK